MNKISGDFATNDNKNFLAYVEQMENLDNSSTPEKKSLQFEDEEKFSSLPPDEKQSPWKDMHYKRSLAQYIKSKYKKTVKITNKFAERTYRDMYQQRIKENYSCSRYMKVFLHPDITKTDFNYIKNCQSKEIKYIMISQALVLGFIGYTYFRTGLGKIMKKNLAVGIGIGMMPFFSIMGIKMAYPLIMDRKLNRAGLMKKYEII